MHKNGQKIAALALSLLFVTLLLPTNAYAQTTIQCKTPEEKIACQAAYEKALAEQKEAEKQLADAQNQSASLSKDIAVLNAKINAAQLKIKAKNLLIKTLGNDITEKQAHINFLELRIIKGRESLSQLLRKMNEIDQYSLPQVILSKSTVSQFFYDVDDFLAVQESLKERFEELHSDQAETSAAKEALDKRRNSEMDIRYEIQQEEKNIQADKTERNRLLAVSKSNEKSYTSLVAERATRAAQIRAALFPLAGGVKIPFGQALQYANLAYQKTGVRPAFLLAILTNESALGANVGQCYLSNAMTGDGIKVSSGAASPKVMAPGGTYSSRNDVAKFMDITKRLGFDPYKTVVSCQQPSVGGWGGAMGPAQFIPTTWSLLESRLAGLLGISDTPNPWNPAHAFMASAMFLADLGASSGGYTAERNAACKYYSGSACTKSRAIAGYGDSAIAEAGRQQALISQL